MTAMACSLLSLEAFKLTGLIMCELPIFPFAFHGLSVSTCLSISLLQCLSTHSVTTTISLPGFELGMIRRVCVCVCVFSM